MVEALKNQGDPSWGTPEEPSTTGRKPIDREMVDFPKPYHATVLVNTRFDNIDDALSAVRGVINAHIVAGKYDLVLTVGGDSFRDIEEIVANDIIPKVKNTTTLYWLS